MFLLCLRLLAVVEIHHSISGSLSLCAPFFVELILPTLFARASRGRGALWTELSRRTVAMTTFQFFCLSATVRSLVMMVELCTFVVRSSSVHRPSIVRQSSVHRPSIVRPSSFHRPSIVRPSSLYRPAIVRPSSVSRPSIVRLLSILIEEVPRTVVKRE